LPARSQNFTTPVRDEKRIKVGYRALMVVRGHRAAPYLLSAVLSGLLCSFIAPLTASAERVHTVKPGQSLTQIAKQYRVDAGALAAANGLLSGEPVKRGQVLTVPEQGVVYVTAGQTLGRIAKTNATTIDALAKANKITPTTMLKVGQRLVLPGYKPSRTEQRWGKPKSAGLVTLHRIWSGETEQLRIVDTRGVVRRPAVREMREFLRPRDSRRRKLPNERLLRLIAKVSDHFGGRPLHVVSGFRLPGGNTRKTSRHVAGEAVDFRIPGVPLEELRDYCQRFPHVGVGFYPRSHFVHLDVRRDNARWTDWSLPGQKAQLTKPDDVDEGTKPVLAEPIMPANEYDIEDDPPAPDDGQPPLDDAPPAPERKATPPAARETPPAPERRASSPEHARK
jgi:uncharacterized protein YcbK (DUF882 family)/LysM repeat protein